MPSVACKKRVAADISVRGGVLELIIVPVQQLEVCCMRGSLGDRPRAMAMTRMQWREADGDNDRGRGQRLPWDPVSSAVSMKRDNLYTGAQVSLSRRT